MRCSRRASAPSGSFALAGAEHALRGRATAGTASWRPPSSAATGPSSAGRMLERCLRGEGAVSARDPARRPKLRGLEVRLLRRLPALDPEPRGGAARAPEWLEISHFLEATRARRRGPVRRLDRRGLGHDARRRRAHPRGARRMSALLMHDRGLRNAGGDPGPAQLRRHVDGFLDAVYATPEYISTLDTSTPIATHVPVDFELQGCPPNSRQVLELISALPRRPPTGDLLAVRLHGVQASRQRLRHGRPRHAVPRSR